MGRPSQSNGKKNARSKWLGNRARQQARGIVWNLDFFDWYDFWLSQGIDKDLPSKKMTRDALCLVRIDESKPYEKGNIMSASQGENATGKPSRSFGKIRPDTWVIKDPDLHKMYLPWLRARSQSWYRLRKGLEEGGWELPFEDYAAKWKDFWPLRGRGEIDFTMSKIDSQKAWSYDNMEIITRRQHIQKSTHNKQNRKIKK
jgi:hypothetical protein